MIAKIIVHEETREIALGALRAALDEMRVAGTITNTRFLAALADHGEFSTGRVDTGLIDRDLEALTRAVPPSAPAAALAALAALGLPREGGSDPWQALTGWRAWGPAQQTALIERDGERLEAKITIQDSLAYTVRIGGDTTRLRFHDTDGAGMTEIDGRGMRADIMSHPSGVTVFLDGADYRFGLPDPVAPSTEGAGGDVVLAPMPGAVKSVTAQVGQSVSKGDALTILEAMKMEHTLIAPRDGVIADVAVTEGDQVEDGAVLITLEPATA